MSLLGAFEAQANARTNRPDYVQEALDKTGELIREASESGELSVKVDFATILPNLDQWADSDKHSLILAHLRLELNTRNYYVKDYEHPVIPGNGGLPYGTKRGFYIYWGWGAEEED